MSIDDLPPSTRRLIEGRPDDDAFVFPDAGGETRSTPLLDEVARRRGLAIVRLGDHETAEEK